MSSVSVNCLDVHVEKHPDRVALIWERDEPGSEVKVTYRYKHLIHPLSPPCMPMILIFIISACRVVLSPSNITHHRECEGASLNTRNKDIYSNELNLVTSEMIICPITGSDCVNNNTVSQLLPRVYDAFDVPVK